MLAVMQRYRTQVAARTAGQALRRGAGAVLLRRCYPFRCASSASLPPDMEVPQGSDDYRRRDDAFTLSTEVRETEEEQATLDEDDFDELEAASQELHDLCYALIAHLRCTDPEANKSLFERRVQRAFREPKPEQYRRLLHGHGDRSLRRRNNYRTRKDFQEAHRLYLQWCDKLLLLLTQPVLDRLVKSAGKGHRDLRTDGVHRYRRHLERATWRSFPHRWFKHAPFEVQQLRADIPESAVLNTRFYRDHATLRYLFTLMEPQHAFREKIEHRMMELTQRYDPLRKSIE
ncbi:hypothetical protein, conserved [Leishmania donovani]|uniref:Uncharacterized protein n=1 Tax=Leishmania donovani TaxID=5661 RepID=A0A3Q8IB97_LEIDO|nr:hypothetical protein, conserved [Leishmania donovani]AYU80490.1 hypothetical protein LdCL_290005300 [Leishmania donovani]TPP52641.1 hypothetical protein CGC21_27580 [Leishmania donovani]CBZ35729.1 hypothetical protein, conserved [Leishmania donovani]